MNRKVTHFPGEMEMENKTVIQVLPKNEGVGVRWGVGLGLFEAEYCLWSGLAMISYCVALGSTSSHL